MCIDFWNITAKFKLTESKYGEYEYDDSAEKGEEDDIFDSFVGDLQGEDGEDGLGSDWKILWTAQKEEDETAHERRVEPILEKELMW